MYQDAADYPERSASGAAAYQHIPGKEWQAGLQINFLKAQSRKPQHKNCLDWQKLFRLGTINAAFPEILFEDNV